MKGFRKLPSQCLNLDHHATKVLAGSHITTTEAQTLEQALRIIESRQHAKKASAARVEANKTPSLKQELNWARHVAAGHDISLANGDVHKGKFAQRWERERKEKPKLPHPYRDLPEADKPAKAREMLASGNWGIGAPCGRRLAVLFKVDHATMASWLDIEIWSGKDFDDQFKNEALRALKRAYRENS